MNKGKWDKGDLEVVKIVYNGKEIKVNEEAKEEKKEEEQNNG